MQVLLGAVLGVFIWVGAVAGPAPAGAITITTGGVVDLTPDLCVSNNATDPCNGDSSDSTLSQDLTITIPGLLQGDLITGELLITLWDDFGKGDANEKINVLVDGVTVLYNANANHDAVIALSDFTSLYDGEIVVRIEARDGDFFLGGASVSLSAERPDAPQGGRLTDLNRIDPNPQVPAPAALLLLGAGSMAVAWTRRQRRGSGPSSR